MGDATVKTRRQAAQAKGLPLRIAWRLQQDHRHAQVGRILRPADFQQIAQDEYFPPPDQEEHTKTIA